MVSIPSFDRSVKSLCAESVGNAVERASWDDLLGEVVHRYVGGYDVACARNEMARGALAAKADYLWMVDSDMVVPDEALARLLSDGVPVATGWYVRGAGDGDMTCAAKRGSTGFIASWRASELVEKRTRGVELLEVKGNGLGCALVRTDVFERIARPWFRFTDHGDGTVLGEDYWFCQRCADAGIPVYVDLRVACGHIHDRVLEAR